MAFPGGPGGFRERREAYRNHAHLSWHLLARDHGLWPKILLYVMENKLYKKAQLLCSAQIYTHKAAHKPSAQSCAQSKKRSYTKHRASKRTSLRTSLRTKQNAQASAQSAQRCAQGFFFHRNLGEGPGNLRIYRLCQKPVKIWSQLFSKKYLRNLFRHQ